MQAGASFSKKQRVLNNLRCITASTFFFRMRLGEHFLQKRADFGLHWAPFGEPSAAFFHNFSGLFSESDFRSVLKLLFEGVGGRGGSAVICIYAEYGRILCSHSITPLPPAGVRRIDVRSTAADPGRLITYITFIGQIAYFGCIVYAPKLPHHTLYPCVWVTLTNILS